MDRIGSGEHRKSEVYRHTIPTLPKACQRTDKRAQQPEQPQQSPLHNKSNKQIYSIIQHTKIQHKQEE